MQILQIIVGYWIRRNIKSSNNVLSLYSNTSPSEVALTLREDTAPKKGIWKFEWHNRSSDNIFKKAEILQAPHIFRRFTIISEHDSWMPNTEYQYKSASFELNLQTQFSSELADFYWMFHGIHTNVIWSLSNILYSWCFTYISWKPDALDLFTHPWT